MTQLILEHTQWMRRRHFDSVGDLFSYILDKYPSNLELEEFSLEEKMCIHNRSDSIRNMETTMNSMIKSIK